MANPATVAGSLTISGTSKITGGIAGGLQSESVQVGQNNFPAINLTVTQAAAAGTTGQATKHYQAQVTLGASSSSSVALTSLTDGLGDAISFTNVKMVLAAIATYGSTKRVVMGANGVANGWYSPFAGITTNGATMAGVPFTDLVKLGSTVATTGYTAGAGNYNLNFQETAGVTTTVQVLIWGN